MAHKRVIWHAIRFVRKRIVPGLLDVLLIVALMHFSILSIYAIANKDASVFNFFKVMSVDWFIPGSSSSPSSEAFSFLIYAALFALVFSAREIFSKRRVQHTEKEASDKSILHRLWDRYVSKESE
jgi:hypothetical protein